MSAAWRFVTDFGDTAVTVPLAALMLLFLLAARQPRLAAAWAVAMLVAAGGIGALKALMAACGHPFGGAGPSSPSGHAGMSLAVYGGFAAVAGAALAPRTRAALVAATVLFVAAIAVSRKVLNHHTAVEVVAGLAVGAAALAFVAAAVRWWPPRSAPLFRLALAAAIVAAIFHGQRWPAEDAVHRVALWLELLRPYCS